MQKCQFEEILPLDYFNSHVYYIINKPYNVLSSREELDNKNENIENIYQIAAKSNFPIDNIGLVGRLDKETTGLMLMTNDARLNRALTFPSEEENRFKEKDYLIRLYSEKLYNKNKEDLEKLRLEMSAPFSFTRGGIVKFASESKVEIINYFQNQNLTKGGHSHLGWCVDAKITIREGKHHQVRRIASRSNLKVIFLQRISIGGVLDISKVPCEGECKYVEYEDVKLLYEGLNLKYNQVEVCGKIFK